MVYLSNFLASKWNNITFYTFSHKQDLFDINFEVKVFNFIKTAYTIRKSDYIIVWNSPMQFVWVLSKVLFWSRAKIIWWHHHYPWYYSKNTNLFIQLKRLLEKLTIKHIDVFVSNSEYLKNVLQDTYKTKAYILNPVIDEYYTKRKQKNSSSSNPIIFTYWRWTAWKNIKQIFDTYLYIKSYIPNVRLLIWGIWEELIHFQNKFELDNNIEFLWLLDKKSIVANLEKSSVFLFSSTIDSFWMTMIEALSIWVPVVAFDKNAANEIVDNWYNWYLVKSKINFSNTTLSILQSQELQRKLWKNALNITTRYWYQNFVSQLDKIFYL